MGRFLFLRDGLFSVSSTSTITIYRLSIQPLCQRSWRIASGYIKFPINEPAEGRHKSQIEEYLDFYNGPGVQHLALATHDILSTVEKMQQQGVSFLTVPHSYYTQLQERIGKIDEPLEELRQRLGLSLWAGDDEGYMLQIFTRPVEDRPTLFFEIIQRIKAAEASARVTSEHCSGRLSNANREQRGLISKENG